MNRANRTTIIRLGRINAMAALVAALNGCFTILRARRVTVIRQGMRLAVLLVMLLGLGSAARADDAWATEVTTGADAPGAGAAASAQVFAEEAEWIAGRAFSQYGAVIDNRGMFERLYDSSGHIEWTILRHSYDDFVAAKRLVHAAVDARNPTEASEQLAAMKLAASRIEHNLEIYQKASASGARALMITTFVGAALLTALVAWLLVSRKRKRAQPVQLVQAYR